MTSTTAKRNSWRGVAIVGIISFVLLLPLLSRAQSAPPSELRAAIKAQLMSDPRTSSLSAAQIDAMVGILAQEAQSRGMSANDVAWHPNQNAVPMNTFAPDFCGAIPEFLCVFGKAFGLLGPDAIIAYILGASSMGLIWVLAEMLHRHRYPAPVVAKQ